MILVCWEGFLGLIPPVVLTDEIEGLNPEDFLYAVASHVLARSPASVAEQCFKRTNPPASFYFMVRIAHHGALNFKALGWVARSSRRWICRSLVACSSRTK